MTTLNSRALAIAFAIAHYEGAFSVKTQAYLYNNPGNLRRWPNTPSSEDGFAHFQNMPDGCAALYQDVLANVGSPLCQFMRKYAPVIENNTNAYLAYVSQWTGILPNETI
jgi:hypothetical protein